MNFTKFFPTTKYLWEAFEPGSENTLLIICQAENSDLQLIIPVRSILKADFSGILKYTSIKFLLININVLVW
jgi:hypothetical protein